jgi:hypothetical protein
MKTKKMPQKTNPKKSLKWSFLKKKVSKKCLKCTFKKRKNCPKKK